MLNIDSIIKFIRTYFDFKEITAFKNPLGCVRFRDLVH